MKRPKKLYFLEYEHNGQVWVKHFKSAAARSRTVRTHPHLKVLRMWTETREEQGNSWPDDAAGHRAAALKRGRRKAAPRPRRVSRRDYFRGLPVVGVTPGDSNAGPNQRIYRVPLADLKPTQRLKETFRKGMGQDVERYRAFLREGLKPPPLTGSFDERTGKVRLSEGHRRFEALKAEGKKSADVIIGGLGDPAPEPVYTDGKFDAAKTFALEKKMPARKTRNNPLYVVNPSLPGGRRAIDLTDRANRYRAQSNVPGPRRCVICGKRSGKLDAMHLSGDETDGATKNLAWGCRSCNAGLGAAFKRIGSRVRTRQYNPAAGGGKIPTFEQYAWGVVHHSRGAHDAGGAVIHATPRSRRIEYAKRIYELRRARGEFEVPF